MLLYGARRLGNCRPRAGRPLHPTTLPALPRAAFLAPPRTRDLSACVVAQENITLKALWHIRSLLVGHPT